MSAQDTERQQNPRSSDTEIRDQRPTERKFWASMTAAETPVLDTLADITAISLERCALPPRELMLARIAALIAVDAPPPPIWPTPVPPPTAASPVTTFRQS